MLPFGREHSPDALVNTSAAGCLLHVQSGLVLSWFACSRLCCGMQLFLMHMPVCCCCLLQVPHDIQGDPTRLISLLECSKDIARTFDGE